MKLVKKIVLLLLLLLIAIQFYRPDQNRSPSGHTTVFLTETNPPEEVRILLKQACYDCHSNTTEYPWYNNIAPISYWLADHIEHGKEELNFSDWSNYTPQKKDHKLEEIAEEVMEGNMPLKEYTWTHKTARLTIEQRNSIQQWVEKTRSLYRLNHRPN